MCSEGKRFLCECECVFFHCLICNQPQNIHTQTYMHIHNTQAQVIRLIVENGSIFFFVYFIHISPSYKCLSVRRDGVRFPERLMGAEYSKKQDLWGLQTTLRTLEKGKFGEKWANFKLHHERWCLAWSGTNLSNELVWSVWFWESRLLGVGEKGVWSALRQCVSFSGRAFSILSKTCGTSFEEVIVLLVIIYTYMSIIWQNRIWG